MATTDSVTVIEALFAVIEARRRSDPSESYVAKRLAQGTPRIAQKLGEEAVETVVAALGGSRDAVVRESADLLFHLLILWADTGVRPADVFAELEQRRGRSGLVEKASRQTDG
jgi:phosphoribosyl-ATP pyrophosphohydrolase